MACTVPKNFSWLEDGKVAGLGFPDRPSDIRFLVQNGIRYLVTLTKEMKPCIKDFPELNHVDISVHDYCTFSLQQVEEFIQVCESALRDGEGIAVHCRAGIGRTGTLLACYLVRFRGMTAHDAITQVRLTRPASVETAAQEETVNRYYQFLCGSRV